MELYPPTGDVTTRADAPPGVSGWPCEEVTDEGGQLTQKLDDGQRVGPRGRCVIRAVERAP